MRILKNFNLTGWLKTPGLILFILALPFGCTTDDPAPEQVIPTVTTLPTFTISQTSIKVFGNVSSDGFLPITERGFLYGQDTGALEVVRVDGTTGTFEAELTGLSSTTTYYVQAFARNEKGLSGGAIRSFRTTAGPVASISLIEAVPVPSNPKAIAFTAEITNLGGTEVTEKGLIYDTKSGAEVGVGTTAKIKVFSEPGGLGSFIDSVKTLTTNTSYFVRAFAKNQAGYAYSNEIKVTTVGLPVLETGNINSSLAGATIRGSLTTSGGLDVSEYGFVWGTAGNPTIDNANKVVIGGSGFVGNYSYLIDPSQLTISPASGFTYNVKAYAINSLGISYGDRESFNYLPIGGILDGGIIFWINPAVASGREGLIMAATDISTGAEWGCIGDSLVTTSSTVDSKTNTDRILTGCAQADIAARLCRSLGSNWHLPSIEALKIINNELFKNGIGGLSADEAYWSSTQASESRSITMKFNPSGDGISIVEKKNLLKRVRAVRTL